MKRWLWRHLLWPVLTKSGYVVFDTRSPYGYTEDGLYTFHHQPFRDDQAFRAAYARGSQAGGFDPRMEWRVHVALWAARQALRVPGDFVECGVNAGFVSSAIMQYVNWGSAGKRFYLIDTFSGPDLSQFSPEEVDRGRRRVAEEALAKGGYVTDVAAVRANYAEWPNVEIVPGTVPDVLPSLHIEDVAFLHLDMNCAYPERAALEYFWELLSPGAMLLLDDYTYYGSESQARAISGAAAKLGVEVLALPTGQGLIVK